MSCGGFFDLPKLQEKLTALEARMAAPDFWNNRDRAQADVDEVSRLRSLINPFRELELEIEDFDALHQLAAEEKNDAQRAQAEKEVATEHDRLIHKLEEFELRQFLSGESDRSNAFITIHSGAGGTESCDWADMLLRMYQRWIERSGLKSQIVDVQTGEEVGIKSVTRSEEHTSELQSRQYLVCRLLLEKKKKKGVKRALAGVLAIVTSGVIYNRANRQCLAHEHGAYKIILSEQ